MRKKINTTDAIFPMPVLMIATFNDDGTVNVMNAAWGTMFSRNEVYLKLTDTHKTVKNIRNRKAFTVSIADGKHMKEADYFGVVSGNNESDKLSKSGLTFEKSAVVDAPIINEFPICMECSFEEDKSAFGIVGKVENVTALEEVLNGDNVDPLLLNALSYDSYTHSYYTIGKKVGDAFKEGMSIKNK